MKLFHFNDHKSQDKYYDVIIYYNKEYLYIFFFCNKIKFG